MAWKGNSDGTSDNWFGDVSDGEGKYNEAGRKHLEDPAFREWFDDASNNSDKKHDPLAIDLDGDGIEFTSLADSTAMFDLNANGFATNAAWISSDDALLAYDRNGDGLINDIMSCLVIQI